MFRRSLISTTGLMTAGAVLAACGANTPSAPGTLPAQILADVQGALTQLQAVLPGLTMSKPPVISQVEQTSLTGDVSQGLSFLATIGPSTPAQTGVTVLARVEGYLNAVLAALVMVPIPSPYNLIVVAANVVAASLEAYINGLIPPAPTPAPAPAATRAASVAHGMTLDQAREVLHIKSGA
jgi:hypothetical protein